MTNREIPAPLLWIVDRQAIGNGSLQAALRAGVTWLHLRDTTVDEADWRGLLDPRSDVRVVVNGGPAWALEAGWGAHLKAAQPPVPGARRAAWGLLGRSVHDPEQTRSALRDRPDYLVAGPVFPTSSKPGHPGIGTVGLRAIVEAAGDTPVLAIGGIRPESVSPVTAVGASGVSVRSGITMAANPGAAVRALLGALPFDP